MSRVRRAQDLDDTRRPFSRAFHGQPTSKRFDAHAASLGGDVLTLDEVDQQGGANVR